MASTSEVKVIISAVDKASADIKKVGDAFSAQADKMRKVGAAFTGVGLGAGFFAKQMVGAAADFEQTQIAFSTMLGSAERANELLAEISEFAEKTPFSFKDVVTGGKQLLAYGFAQEEVIETTRMLGDVSAGLSVPIGDMIYLFGTLRAQNRAYTKDLNQFTARGVPILEQLAQQYGITTAQVFEFAEAGKISFADIEQAFVSMTSEGGLFFNMMDAQSASFLGMMSNLTDQIDMFMREGGKPLMDALKGILLTLMELVSWMNSFAAAHPEMVKWVGLLAAGTAALMIPLGAFLIILPGLIAGIGILATVIGAVTLPVFAVGVAIVALIAILTVLIIKKDEILAKATEVWNKYGKLIQGFLMVVAPQLNLLISLVRAIIAVQDEVRDVAEEVWGMIPDFVKSGVASIIANINPLFGVLKNLLDLFNQIRAATERIGGEEGGGGFVSKVRGLVPFAEGGIVTKPTAALVGEAGPEAIIPLSKLGRGGGPVNITIVNKNPMFLDRDAGRLFGRQLLDELKEGLGSVA